MQKSTFSVNFFIRRTRLGKSGETPIMMRISVDGRYTELSTQRRVPVEQWSQSRCCATGKTAVALEINRHLDNLRSKASEAHQNFLAEDGYVDPFIIKEFLQHTFRRTDIPLKEYESERYITLPNGNGIDIYSLQRSRRAKPNPSRIKNRIKQLKMAALSRHLQYYFCISSIFTSLLAIA